MKVAFIIDGFPKLSETFILKQITGLLEQGHEVDIYSDKPTNEPKVHQDIQHYNLLEKTRYTGTSSNQLNATAHTLYLTLRNFHKAPVALLKSWNVPQHQRQGTFLRTMLPCLAIQFINSHRAYDIIHCHFGWNGLKASFLKRVGLLRGKLIVTFHGYDVTAFPREKGEQVYRSLFELGDLFLPISDRWREHLIKLGCQSRKIVVHRMGVDCEQITPVSQNLNYTAIQITSVARLVEKKGIEYGIRSIAKLIEANYSVKYTIVGDGPLRKNLQQLTEALGVGPHVIFLGWQQQEEVTKILAKTDILLAPSVTSCNGDQEGIPVSLMEAMAMGLPVVSTLHSGIPELIEDRVTGLLAPERDVDALVQNLSQLADNQALRRQMGEKGRSFVETHYNIKHLNNRLTQLYQLALNQ